MRKNKVEYAVVCSTGKLRQNNEDNFYCCGQFRDDVDDTADVAYSGVADANANELFAVYDGMGGESCGEVASLIASLQSQQFARSKDAYTEYLQKLAALINEKIRAETEKRSLVLMGTTAAMLQVSGEDIYILNAGDSRIYKLSRHELRQISIDHVAVTVGGSAITQFLGMPEGYNPAPYVAKGRYKQGDVFLLCSDGVTDMLSDSEILRIIDDRMDVDILARALVDAVLEKGGIDNITVMLLRFKR